MLALTNAMQLPPIIGSAYRENGGAPRRRLPLLALPGTAASARKPSPLPTPSAGRGNDQHQAR
jgi:hypothetical protein